VAVQVTIKCVGGLFHRNNDSATATRKAVLMPAIQIPTAENGFEILRSALADQFGGKALLIHGT
jgi:hypothetical protein